MQRKGGIICTARENRKSKFSNICQIPPQFFVLFFFCPQVILLMSRYYFKKLSSMHLKKKKKYLQQQFTCFNESCSAILIFSSLCWKSLVSLMRKWSCFRQGAANAAYLIALGCLFSYNILSESNKRWARTSLWISVAYRNYLVQVEGL